MQPEIWSRIQEVITHCGLTQAALAAEIGIASPTVTRWKKGEITPSITTLNKICAATGCNLHWLRDGEGEMFPPGNVIIQGVSGGMAAGRNIIGSKQVNQGQQLSPEMQEFISLFDQYGSPKLLQSFKDKLLSIKEMIDGDS